MLRSPNTAHFNLLGIPSLLAAALAGLAIGNYFITLLLWAVLIPVYSIAYLKYFALFSQDSKRTAATVGFIGLQLAFWGLILLLVRIVSFSPSAIYPN